MRVAIQCMSKTCCSGHISHSRNVQSRATGIEDKWHHVLRAVVGARPDLRTALWPTARTYELYQLPMRPLPSSEGPSCRMASRGWEPCCSSRFVGGCHMARWVGNAIHLGLLALQRARATSSKENQRVTSSQLSSILSRAIFVHFLEERE
jgi:hypothetical protein